MAKQAEAEREKRAKIIHAEGEFNAALLATQPITIQLRYLQTLTEIRVEKNTTIVFPLPVEMFSLFKQLRAPAKLDSSRVVNHTVRYHSRSVTELSGLSRPAEEVPPAPRSIC